MKRESHPRIHTIKRQFNARPQRRKERRGGENWNVSCIRRGWVPQPVGRGNLSPTIDTAPQIVPHLAPEGRHVYRIPHTTNNQSPRGATCPTGYGRHENWNVSNRSCIRRGWVPQPAGRGNLSPTIDTAPPILPHLAPEGRMFIEYGIHQITKAPEGRQVPPRYRRRENWNVSNRSCIRRGWVPQPVGRGNLSPTIDTAPPIVPHLAPEGRHVYRIRHTTNTPKPQRGDMSHQDTGGTKIGT